MGGTGNGISVLFGERKAEGIFQARIEQGSIADAVSDPVPQTTQVSRCGGRITGDQREQVDQAFVSPEKIVLCFALADVAQINRTSAAGVPDVRSRIIVAQTIDFVGVQKRIEIFFGEVAKRNM